MLGSMKGMLMTLITTMRKPVTAQYPKERLVTEHRRMGFPMLTWDSKVEEPYCTGCGVCWRECPTQCMSGKMMDNPLYAEGKSPRRKNIEWFEINMSRCILCSICVDVCNFDAIEMSYETELSTQERNGRRMKLEELLERGSKWQQQSGWDPEKERPQATEQSTKEDAPA